MKGRAEVVLFIDNQLNDDGMKKQMKYGPHHYGRVELKELMDFIYGEEPKSENEMIAPDKYHTKDNN